MSATRDGVPKNKPAAESAEQPAAQLGGASPPRRAVGDGRVAGVIGAARARLLVVAALIAGLLSMHALVVVGGHAAGSPGGSGSPAASGSPGMAMIVPAGPAADPGAPTGAAGPATPMVGAHQVVAPAGTTAGPADTATAASGPVGPPHPAGQHAMLLCLAVLTALLLLAVAALVLAVPLRDSDTEKRLRHARGGPRPQPARPPPTTVRLAQLCVLRN